MTIKILIPRRRDKAAADSLDKGIESYQKGDEQNYKKAAELFEKALQIDPTYSQAAFYLGLTYNALFDEDKAAAVFQEGHRRSIPTTWRRAPPTPACCSISATWTKPSARSTPCCSASPTMPWPSPCWRRPTA